MKIFLILLTFICISCQYNSSQIDILQDMSTSKDVSKDTYSTDFVITQFQNFTSKDLDIYEKKHCSPSGLYTVTMNVHDNTCSPSIVSKLKWTGTAFFKSQPCYLTYYQSTYYISDFITKCDEYTQYYHYCIKLWTNCIVYDMINGEEKKEICKFSYESKCVKPDAK